ncbi:hypothetical protein F5Y15DRAFT_35366 [Xylariaceae sp. FL0016]|nr:hypothetical protein F5Y15DRAFT_35366 [Xylariaceae sp. FL0016]
MARRPAKSVANAEKQALQDENESQDSQVALAHWMQTHGAGVYSSSPAPENSTSRTSVNRSPNPKPCPAQNNPDASIATDIPSTRQPTQNSIRTNTSASHSSEEPLSLRPEEIVQFTGPYAIQNAVAPIDVPSPLTRDDAPSEPPSPKERAPKQKARAMSSQQSLTQANEGRSYEQYQSPDGPTQTGSSQDNVTFHEDDTGFVDFGGHHMIPQDEPEQKSSHDVHLRSQGTSQALSATEHHGLLPKTLALTKRPMIRGDSVLKGSPLFEQTQPTSAVRKASPTSSRPSPDLYNQRHSISPNHLISSPLKDRFVLPTSPPSQFVSSPNGFPGHSSRPSEDKIINTPMEDKPDNLGGCGKSDSEGPALPNLYLRRARRVPEPISEIPSYPNDQDSDATKSSSQASMDSDFDNDAEFRANQRRRQAASMRTRASRSLSSVAVTKAAPQKSDVEVPSTNRSKPCKIGRSDSEIYRAQCYGKRDTDKDGSQDTVADSQVVPEPKEFQADAPEELLGPLKVIEDLTPSNEGHSGATARGTVYTDTVPETSPPGTSAKPPKLIGDLLRQQPSVSSGEVAASLPDASDNPGPEEHPDLSNHSSLPEANPNRFPPRRSRMRVNLALVDSSPSVIVASSQPKPTRSSVRLGAANTPTPTSSERGPPSDSGTTTSALSSLSATPSVASSTTPRTEKSNEDGEEEQPHRSSPVVDKFQRKNHLASPPFRPSSSLPGLKTYSRARGTPRKGLRVSSRHSSVSLDELGLSPSVSADDKIRRAGTRKRKSFANLQSTRNSHAGGIFDGMVFAISFQRPEQKGKDKQMDRTAFERKIRQEGGRILSDGFNELFISDSLHTSSNVHSHPVLSSSLDLLDNGTGFTALIADGHSRKVKYMQALALGIPCLASRWVTTCIAKKEIVDWSSYLLCAGQSTLLGDAIRSRNLQPYDATTAKLAEVVTHRPKFFDRSNILFVTRNAKNEEKRKPYIFLAQVLGASLELVRSMEEARTKLRQRESQDEAFDWVYVEGHVQDAQDTLFGSRGTSKKRKRQTKADEEEDRPPKKIRALVDELVIQSLILGRLIEDGEMEE